MSIMVPLKRIPLLLWLAASVAAAALSLMNIREHRLLVAQLAIQDLATLGSKSSTSHRADAELRARAACQRLAPLQIGLLGTSDDYVGTGCKSVLLDGKSKS